MSPKNYSNFKLIVRLVAFCGFAFGLSGCSVWQNIWIAEESNVQLSSDAQVEENFVPTDIVKQASLFPTTKAPQALDENEAIAPVDVSVAQAFFDSKVLNVKVHLKTLTDMDPKDIVVGVSGLREGSLVEETYQRVSEVVNETELDEDSVVALRFKLNSEDLSEYQVKCSWGKGVELPQDRLVRNDTSALELVKAGEVEDDLLTEDSQSTDEFIEEGELDSFQEDADIQIPAKGVTRASLSRDPEILEAVETDSDVEKEEDALPSSSLEIYELDIENETILCDTPPCDIIYTVLAELKNNGSEEVNSVQLAVGLYWANSGQLPRVPSADAVLQENEELIELKDLGITSNNSRTVRVKLDRSVPDVPGGSFIPHVRLLK